MRFMSLERRAVCMNSSPPIRWTLSVHWECPGCTAEWETAKRKQTQVSKVSENV